MRYFATSSIFLFCACSEKETQEGEGPTEDTTVDTETENLAPSISITSHEAGVEVFEGIIERFQATVSDDDHENTEDSANHMHFSFLIFGRSCTKFI